MNDPFEVDRQYGRPTPSSGLTFVGLLVGALLAAMLFGQLTDPGSPRVLPVAVVPTRVADLGIGPDLAPGPDLADIPDGDKPVGVDSLKRCQANVGGLALSDHGQRPGWALERWDCGALKGPWSVVIRANDGIFGVHSAVATFPVRNDGSGTAIGRPQGGMWSADAGRLVWPLAGQHAQIVGDIGQSALVDLATRITIEAGKPHLRAMDGFTIGATITYRSPVVHEMRYGTRDLGHQSTLGDGLVYTGAMSGGYFESQAFLAHAKPAGSVFGKPAIYSGVQGGNGTLAWESAPGQVTYIGYSGSAAEADAIAALRALAEKGRPLTAAQWEAKDRIPVGG